MSTSERHKEKQLHGKHRLKNSFEIKNRDLNMLEKIENNLDKRKTANRKKLPALKSNKDVSKIADEIEKELERKEKDFIIRILSSSMTLQPIREAKEEVEKIENLKSKHRVAQDILEIKAIKPHIRQEETEKQDRELKTMSASLPSRHKKAKQLNQRSSSFDQRFSIETYRKNLDELSPSKEYKAKTYDKKTNDDSHSPHKTTMQNKVKKIRFKDLEIRPASSLQDLKVVDENDFPKTSRSASESNIREIVQNKNNSNYEKEKKEDFDRVNNLANKFQNNSNSGHSQDYLNTIQNKDKKERMLSIEKSSQIQSKTRELPTESLSLIKSTSIAMKEELSVAEKSSESTPMSPAKKTFKQNQEKVQPKVNNVEERGNIKASQKSLNSESDKKKAFKSLEGIKASQKSSIEITNSVTRHENQEEHNKINQIPNETISKEFQNDKTLPAKLEISDVASKMNPKVFFESREDKLPQDSLSSASLSAEKEVDSWDKPPNRTHTKEK